MKKDRVVALCICVLLLANFQLQQIAGIWQLSMPSLPQTIWAFAMGRPFGMAGFPCASGKKLQSPGPSSFIAGLVHAGWPQLAFVYDEILALKDGMGKHGRTSITNLHRDRGHELHSDNVNGR